MFLYQRQVSKEANFSMVSATLLHQRLILLDEFGKSPLLVFTEKRKMLAYLTYGLLDVLVKRLIMISAFLLFIFLFNLLNG